MIHDLSAADRSRLTALGLDFSFGLVAASEVEGNPDTASACRVHEDDGEPCDCYGECRDWLAVHVWPEQDASRGVVQI